MTVVRLILEWLNERYRESAGRNIEPAFHLEPGRYPISVLKDVAPLTYESSEEMLGEIAHIEMPQTVEFRIVRALNIFKNDIYVKKMVRYYTMGWKNFSRKVRSGTITREELEDVEYFAKSLEPEFLLEAMHEKFERITGIINEISATGTYYPPAISYDHIVIDGAHRVIAMIVMGVREFFAWILPVYVKGKI